MAYAREIFCMRVSQRYGVLKRQFTGRCTTGRTACRDVGVASPSATTYRWTYMLWQRYALLFHASAQEKSF